MAKLTVDNLGIGVSTRYAQDQEDYDKSIITDARVSGQTQIDVTRPSQISELDQLLNLEPKVTPWSNFEAPPKFYSQNRGLFSFQLIPSMGTEEKQENLVSRLQSSLTPIKDESLKGIEMKSELLVAPPQESQAPSAGLPTIAGAPPEALVNAPIAGFAMAKGVTTAEFEKQKIVLLKMFTTTATLGKDLNRVIAERNRYHKG